MSFKISLFFIASFVLLSGLNSVSSLTYQNGSNIYGILVDSGNTNITGALNLTFQIATCSLSTCSDANWSTAYTNASYTSLVSLRNATYFQYRATFFTQDQNYTPYLFNVSMTYTYLDTVFPLINYSSETAVNYANLSQNWIFVNTSVIELNPANITFTLNNLTTTINSTTYSMANQNSNISINWTNLTNGYYTYYVNITDFAGNLNSTEIRTITLDTSMPIANLTIPANNTYTNVTSQNLTANLSDAGTGIKNATLNVYNSTNDLINQTTTSYATGTLTATVGVVVNLVGGVYNWFYSLFDWAGNSYNTANNTLTIDTINPQINFTDPTPINYTGRSQNFIINATIIEVNLANVTLNWNGNLKIFNLTNESLVNLGNNNWVFAYNQTGLLPGQIYYYQLNVTDLASNKNSTEVRLIKGAVAPSYVSIVQSPNITDYDNLDPNANVTITANLSDADNNFDTAILQWKNSSASSWTNITMQNITVKGIYTLVDAILSLPSYEDNITYRIWANDTVGEVSNSSSYIIQSFWDCTWTATPDLSSTAGWDEKKFIGNITLTNTGDAQYANNNCTLTFRLNHDLTEGIIYFDGIYFKPSGLYTISAKSNQTIQVNASFLSEVKQENAIITTSELYGRSLTSSRNTTAVIISNQNGPYLYQTMTTYPTVVYLTSKNFSLNGYLRNLMGSTTINENNTAYNISFYWTLPSGLINVSGNLTANYTNISDNGLYYNNLNFGFSNLASMGPGVQAISLFTQGYDKNGNLIVDASNNTLLTNSINVSFLCYNVSDGVYVSACGSLDGDYVAPPNVPVSSGGGGGGGGVANPTAVVTSAEYQLVRGEQNEVKIIFKNTDSNKSLKDLIFSVDGKIAKYINISPKEISSLSPDSQTTIILKILSPTYIELGKQELTITMKAKKEGSDYTDSKKITLEIHELSLDNANELLNSSRDLISQLNEANLSSDSLTQLLNQSDDGIKTFNLELVRDNYQIIQTQVKEALNSKKIIEQIDALIKSAQEKGIDVSESLRLYKLAELSLERREFNQAYKRAQDSQLTYALEIKGEYGKLSYYLKQYPKEISFGALFLVIFSFGAYNINKLRVIKKKIKELKEEEKILNELVRVVQQECFKDKKLSMGEYETAMKEYNGKLSLVVEGLIELETKRVQMLRFASKEKRLRIEKEKIISLIKELQEDYMKKKKLETRTYELKMESFNKRLSEIEERLATLEAEKAIKGLGISLRIPKGE